MKPFFKIVYNIIILMKMETHSISTWTIAFTKWLKLPHIVKLELKSLRESNILFSNRKIKNFSKIIHNTKLS